MTARAGVGRILVIIPTYNELENLPLILERVRASVPEAHILVADDASPDGTGQFADHFCADDDHVHVLHRPEKRGLGAAYLDAFRWGSQHGFDVLVEMDADGSHQPEQLESMLARIEAGADVVLGSRYVPGGAVQNWPMHRELLSRGANFYTRLALGFALHDATAGYRVYRNTALQKMGLDGVESQGYCFQIDLTWRAVRAGLRIDEVPITFVERQLGGSKMSRGVVLEALLRVAQWGYERRAEQWRDWRASRSA